MPRRDRCANGGHEQYFGRGCFFMLMPEIQTITTLRHKR